MTGHFRLFSRFFFICWTLALFSCLAGGGVVQSVDGTSSSGIIRIEKGGLAVAGETSVHIPAGDILDATFIEHPQAVQLRCGVMLTDGGAIAGDIILRADQTTLHLELGDRVADIPMTQIARVIFRPVPPEIWGRIPPGHSGAILDNGDFSEGDFQGIDGSKLKISSLLFGVTAFDTDTKALAVVLREIQPQSANWIVRLRNGSVVLAEKIQFNADSISAQDSMGHSTRMTVGQIAEIRVGPKQMDYLSDHKPDSVDSLDENPWAADMVVTNGVAMRLRGVSITHGISETAGTSLTFSLPQPRRALVARVGIPSDMPPYAKVQFVVLADGREVYRSPAITSADEPAFVNVPVDGVKQITLKVESDLRGDLGAIGLWGDVALVRPIEQPATAPAQ